MLLKKPINAVIAAILLLTPLIVAPTVVHACSCLPGDTEDYYSRSDVVFKGRATMVDLAEGEEAEIGAANNYITFENLKLFKGQAEEETLEVYTSSNSAACGVYFEEGKTYMVFATEQDGELATFLCDGTTELTAQNSDLEDEVVDLGRTNTGGDYPSDDKNNTPKDEQDLLNARLNLVTTLSSSNLLFSIINTVLLLFALVGVGILVRPHDPTKAEAKEQKMKEKTAKKVE